jgi:hypothetical protein
MRGFAPEKPTLTLDVFVSKSRKYRSYEERRSNSKGLCGHHTNG